MNQVTSAGLLNASAQLFGIVFTLLCGWLLNSYGDRVCNGTLTVALLIGAILSIIIRPELKRQKAMNGTNPSQWRWQSLVFSLLLYKVVHNKPGNNVEVMNNMDMTWFNWIEPETNHDIVVTEALAYFLNE